uniref:Uncharacterized protein n=1 Tax=Bicosoecida sp. CB-2014 TaxID=1486930 RepID=A0A7S1GDA2_9STRA
MASHRAFGVVGVVLVLAFASPSVAQDSFDGQFLLTADATARNASIVAVVYNDFARSASPNDDGGFNPRYAVGQTLDLSPFTCDVADGVEVPIFRAGPATAVVVVAGSTSGADDAAGLHIVTAQFNETAPARVVSSVALDASVASGASYADAIIATTQLDTTGKRMWAVRDGGEVGSFDLATGKWSSSIKLHGTSPGDWLTTAFASKAQDLIVVSVSALNQSAVRSWIVSVGDVSNVTATRFTVPAANYVQIQQEPLRRLNFDPLTGIAWFVRTSVDSMSGGRVANLAGLDVYNTQGGAMNVVGPIEGGGDGWELCADSTTKPCSRINAGSSMWYGLLDPETETDGVAFVTATYPDGKSTTPTQHCFVFDQISDGQGWQVGMSGCFLPDKRVVGVAAA